MTRAGAEERRDAEWWHTRLEGATAGPPRFKAWCPVHEGPGSSASLSVTDRPGKDALVHCHSQGCEYDEVLAALAGGDGDVAEYTARPVHRNGSTPPRTPPDGRKPLEWLSAYTGVPTSFLVDLPLRETRGGIEFLFGDGAGVKTRQTGSKEFKWRGSSPPLWPVPVDPPARVWVTEGETDAIVLMYRGVPAHAVTKGAKGTPHALALEELHALGVEEVVVAFDLDEAGDDGADELAEAAALAGIRILRAHPPVSALRGEKDWRDWHLNGGTIPPDPTALVEGLMLDVDRIIAQASVSLEAIVPGWINDRAVTLVAGLPKSGKSTFVWGAVGAILRGAEFLGVKAAPRSVVFMTEEGPGTIVQKVHRFDTVPEDEGVHFVIVPRYAATNAGLSGMEVLEHVVGQVADLGPTLVVMDSLTAWAAIEDENDAQTVGAAMHRIRALTVERGIPLVIVHQQNKAGGRHGTSVRGSGEIFAQVETLIEVDRAGAEAHGEQARALTVTSRYEDAPESVVAVLAGAEWLVSGQIRAVPRTKVLERRDALVTLLRDSPRTKASLARELGVSERTVQDDLAAIEALYTASPIGAEAGLWSLPDRPEGPR